MTASIDLTGRRIVVGGGTGDVGVEIVARLLAAGADVVVPVRNSTKAAALGTHARLTVIEGFPQDDGGVAALQEQLAATGPIHGAVASLGPWFHGPVLTRLPKKDWDAMVAASLTSHFLFASSTVPMVAPGGQYILINGGAALGPVPHSGVVSILTCAQTMLAKVLAAEHSDVGVHTLMLRSVIATRARTSPDPRWITATEVGDACAWILTPQGRLSAGSVVTMDQKPPIEK